MEVSKEMEGNLTIGVLSDTHVPTKADKIPEEVKNKLREEKADLIIHAGDLVSREVIEELEKIAEVAAVRGNMDQGLNLPKTAAIKINRFRLGVIHNTLNPVSNKMIGTAKENDLDLIIFGHTHRKVLETREGIWFLNPGSPTDPFFNKASFALIEIDEETISPKIVELEPDSRDGDRN